VSIDNHSGKTYNNATMKLIAGDVNRVRNFPMARGVEMYEDAQAFSAAKQESFQEKEFFDYHLYTLQRKATIAQNETKQIQMFDAEDVACTKLYKLYQGRENADIVVTFKNTKENHLGVPMPKGVVRLHKNDGETLEFIGEDRIDHTARQEEVSLRVGEAFDILGEEEQTMYNRISDKVHEKAYRIVVKNRKEKETVKVIVERRISKMGEVLRSSIPHKRKNLTTIEFVVEVPAGEEVELTYKQRDKY
jgi:hypothetical protein